MTCRSNHGGFCHNVDANERDQVNTPSEERCAKCPFYDGPARGLGDLVAKVTTAIGIEPCGGCKERQAALNRALPISRNCGKCGKSAQVP